jgi:hypothetical protein
MASILGEAIWLIAGGSLRLLAFVFSFAIIVDMARWKFAPEFRLSSYQRQMSFQRALDDPVYSLQYKRRFQRYTVSIYWAWWLYTAVALCVPIITRTPINPYVTQTVSEFYPFLRSSREIVQTFGLQSRAAFSLNFYSVTWVFMIVAAISEISGGAYFYFHRPINGIVIGKQALTKSSRLGLARIPLVLFCMAITYCLIGFTELNNVGVSRPGAPIGAGHPVPGLMFVYIIIINGLALLSTAGLVRALYGYLLLLTTVVFPMDGSDINSDT